MTDRKIAINRYATKSTSASMDDSIGVWCLDQQEC